MAAVGKNGENPSDWRTAVDATSGRTYWYHRKTRISTWVCPFEQKADDSNESQIISSQQHSQGAIYSKSEGLRQGYEQLPDQGNTLGYGREKVHSLQEGKAQRLEPEQHVKKENANFITNSLDSKIEIGIRELVQCMAHVVRAGAAGNSIFSLPIQLHAMMTDGDGIRDSCMLLVPQSVWCDLIDELVALVLKEEEEGDAKQLQHSIRRRRAALQSFWLLSLFSAAIATVPSTAVATEDQQRTRLSACFQASRSWLQLLGVAQPAARPSASQPSCVLEAWWRQDDRESAMLLCGALSCLAAQSSMAELISDSSKISLAGFLYNQLLSLSGPKQERQPALDLQHFFLAGEPGQVGADRHGGMGLGILDKAPLQFLTALAADKGHSLPALLLLLLGHDLVRPTNPARDAWLRSGGLSALQCMSICSQLDQDLVSAAKQLLTSAMELSPSVREMVLESYLSLAADVGRGAIPIGPSPDLRVRVAIREGGRSRQEGLDGRQEGEGDGEEDGDSAAQFLTELDLEELEQRLEEMRRDIEWIPSVGAPWRVSAVLLWSRCPELRELINHYWERDESGRGGLEIRLDIPGYVMGCICRYLHTGIYSPPCHMEDLLQLLKASRELGMHALTALASNDVRNEISSANLTHVMQFAEDSKDPDLTAACRQFTAQQAANLTSQGQGQGRRQAYEVEPTSSAVGLGLLSAADSRQSGQGRSTIATNSLREAVHTSIVDVTRALQTAYPASSNPGTVGQGARRDGPVSLRTQDLASKRASDPAMGSSRRPVMMADDEEEEEEEEGRLRGSHRQLPDDFDDEEYDEHDLYMEQSLALGKSYLKPRSGGIYSLLLKAQGGSGPATSPVQPSLGPSARRKQASASVAAAAPSAADGGGGVGRAAALLAAAGPRDQSSRDSSRERRGSNNSSSGKRDVREAPTGQGSAVEFNRKMSLEPPKDKDKDAAARSAAGATTVKRVASSSSSTSSSMARPAALNAPKRAQSPLEKEKDTPHDLPASRDGHAAPPASKDKEKPVDVRGSLTLLKTKTRIKRRTAADIEEHEQQLQEAVGAAHTAAALRERDDPSHQSSFIASRAQLPSHQTSYADQHLGHLESDSRRVTTSNSYRESVDSDTVDGGFAEAGPSMLTCPSCGRHFNPTPFEKHVKICKKVFVQKRKVFDSSSMRSRGIPDLQEMMMSQSGAKGKKGKKSPAANLTHNQNPPDSKVWKQQSEAFREAIRAAREFKEYEQKKQEAMAFGGPLPPPPAAARPSAVDPTLIPCPHCERRFSQKAAERHIPQCQSIRAKPAALKKGSGLGIGAPGLGRQSLGGSSTKSRGWQ